MHEPPCEPLVKCKEETGTRLEALEEKVCKIEKNSDDILDILNTWNEGKTIAKWLKIGSKIAIWAAGTWAAIIALMKYIKEFHL